MAVKYARRFPKQSADYTKAKKVIDTLAPAEVCTIEVDSVSRFRDYLSRLSSRAEKTYTTKVQEGKLFIVRII